MTDNEKTTTDLITIGHDHQLVKRVEETASSLRRILHEIPAPPADDLKKVFQDSNDHD